MAWKIVFSYPDGGEISVSKRQKTLTKETAQYYQEKYARPSNDGGMVYISPFRKCTPVPLAEYIGQQPKYCLTEDCPYQKGDPCEAAETCGGYEGAE